MYNHDPVLPIGNILKPRRRFLGQEPHKIDLEQQHKLFVMVHQHLKKTNRRQRRYIDKTGHNMEFQVGVPVYPKQQQCKSKLQGRWYPYYRIIEKTTPVTFCHKNQLDGTITKAHAKHLQLAQLDDSDILKDEKDRHTCKVTYTALVNLF